MMLMQGGKDRLQVLSASRRFSGFAPEASENVRDCTVKRNPALERMIFEWKRFQFKDDRSVDYPCASEIASGFSYSSSDVELFCVALAACQDDNPRKAGIFLSALIRCCPESDYIIRTSHLTRIELLGYKNTKNIRVIGDAGDSIAAGMEGGTIIVEGNAGSSAANDMKGGSITVRGNTGINLGYEMKGGSIIIEGDVDNFPGIKMRGGSILVKGNAGHMVGSRMKYGSIIVEGNVGGWVADFMEGGTIRVKGDAGDDIGHWMSGGALHLMGEYGYLSGDIMGGRIFVKGWTIYPTIGVRDSS